jgi:hypothetical protein
MCVGDGGHGVDLEILVGSDNGNSLDWSPVGERWLSIIEPLVADVLDMVVINVGNSLGNLRSWESSAKLEHVLTNVLVHGLWGLGGEEFVVKVVSTSDNLDVVEVMRVDGWKADSAVVHLSGEDLVTEEVVSEKSSITVWEVVGLSSSDIWEITEEGVHGVVLLVAVVEMLSMLIDSVGSEHVLQEEETVVVLVLDTWSIVEDSDVTVVHLIISDEENGWDVDGLIGILGWNSCVLWESSKVLLNGINDRVVGNITGGDDDHVVTVVVGGVVVSELVHSQSVSEISISLDWLTKHVLSVGVEMSVFKSGLLEPVVVVLMLHADLILDELKLGRVKGVVGKHISEESNGVASISLKDLKAIVGLLSIRLSVVSGSHVLDCLSNLGLGSRVGTSQGHLLEKVTGTCGHEILISGSSSNVNTDMGSCSWNSFSANSDSILKGGGVEWSDVFEWLWDVSEWEFSKVGHDWLLGELHELLLGCFLSQTINNFNEEKFNLR